MAPTPPTTAGRLKVQYSDYWRTHHMLFHFAPGVDGDEAANLVDPILTAMAATLFNSAGFTTADWYPAGSHFGFPQALLDTYPGASGTPPVTAAPSNFIQFGGRNPNGKRVKYYLFGSVFSGKVNMRQNFGDNALCDAIITAIDAATAGGTGLACIDGVGFATYTYGNLGQNDYITGKVR